MDFVLREDFVQRQVHLWPLADTLPHQPDALCCCQPFVQACGRHGWSLVAHARYDAAGQRCEAWLWQDLFDDQ